CRFLVHVRRRCILRHDTGWTAGGEWAMERDGRTGPLVRRRGTAIGRGGPYGGCAVGPGGAAARGRRAGGRTPPRTGAAPSGERALHSMGTERHDAGTGCH